MRLEPTGLATASVACLCRGERMGVVVRKMAAKARRRPLLDRRSLIPASLCGVAAASYFVPLSEQHPLPRVHYGSVIFRFEGGRIVGRLHHQGQHQHHRRAHLSHARAEILRPDGGQPGEGRSLVLLAMGGLVGRLAKGKGLVRFDARQHPRIDHAVMREIAQHPEDISVVERVAAAAFQAFQLEGLAPIAPWRAFCASRSVRTRPPS